MKFTKYELLMQYKVYYLFNDPEVYVLQMFLIKV